jgi:uncharacterized cupin superfamily protein
MVAPKKEAPRASSGRFPSDNTAGKRSPWEDLRVGFSVFRSDEREWSTPSAGDQTRGIVRLSDAMAQMRANIWRLAPGSRGRRHAERVQEEVFVVLAGTTTLALGDPPERVELPTGSVSVVEPGTALQLLNECEAETTVLIVGAPPETGQADYLPDAEL